MVDSKILIYDGSFNGFLTAIYVAFENKLSVSDIQSNSVEQNGLFSNTETIFTQMDKAERVWNGIRNRSDSAIRKVYFAYLSEYEGIEHILYMYIKRLFAGDSIEYGDHMDGIALKVAQLARNVAKEKERLEAFIGFELTRDEVYFSAIKPNYNVLPLISRHFKSRIPGHKWIIYDMKREYGLFYDRYAMEVITLRFPLNKVHGSSRRDSFSSEGKNGYGIFMDDVKDTDILACINEKLLSRDIPKNRLEYPEERKAV